jgi:hypothetical protein
VRRLGGVRPEGLPLVDRVVSWAEGGWGIQVGYWSAVLVGEMVSGRRDGEEYDRAFAAERSVQAAWLAAELELSV